MWVLVIVVVAAIGAGLAGCWKQKADRDALAECEKNLKNLGTAMEMYSTDNGGRFPRDPQKGDGSLPTPLRLPQAFLPNYLKMMRTCPAAGTDTYSNSGLAACSPDCYTIVFGGHHHAGSGQGPNFPQYSSTLGLISQ